MAGTRARRGRDREACRASKSSVSTSSPTRKRATGRQGPPVPPAVGPVPVRDVGADFVDLEPARFLSVVEPEPAGPGADGPSDPQWGRHPSPLLRRGRPAARFGLRGGPVDQRVLRPGPRGAPRGVPRRDLGDRRDLQGHDVPGSPLPRARGPCRGPVRRRPGPSRLRAQRAAVAQRRPPPWRSPAGRGTGPLSNTSWLRSASSSCPGSSSGCGARSRSGRAAARSAFR